MGPLIPNANGINFKPVAVKGGAYGKGELILMAGNVLITKSKNILQNSKRGYMQYTLNIESIIESCVQVLEKSQDPVHRRYALLVLTLYAGGYGSEGDGLTELINTTLEEDPDANVRRYAAWALRQIGDENTEFKNLLKALKDKDWRVRLEAADTLGNFVDNGNRSEVASALLEALGDKHPVVRMHALQLIFEIDNDDVLQHQINKIILYGGADNNPTLIG